MTDRLTRDVEQLVSQNGLKDVIGALARYCYLPNHQHYPRAIMATMFRRLNKLYEYLDERSQ